MALAGVEEPERFAGPAKPADAVRSWRRFATRTLVTWNGEERTWAQHIGGTGYIDEDQLVGPRVFPAFARALLGFEVGVTLAAEQTRKDIRPDFTPADAVTHPFVFEIKGTNSGVELEGHRDQIERYLRSSRQRIRWVVLTNLVGVRIFELAEGGALEETLRVNLVSLLGIDEAVAIDLPAAERLARFLDLYRRRTLSTDEKLARARRAPPWVPHLEATESDWLSARLDSVVRTFTSDAAAQLQAGALADEAHVTDPDRDVILAELHGLEWRLGNAKDAPVRSLSGYLGAGPTTTAGKALRQFEAHVAYFAATRLLLVRVFEDLELLDPVLYDGGLDQWLTRLMETVPKVVEHSFAEARETYPSLFEQRNAYTWYRPSRDALIEAIYELANTYLGAIQSDVLGAVYERLLVRVDRKLLGQYYTPRDIIALIWEMLDLPALAGQAEAEQRELRVLDIATGSGGFLVEAVKRLRVRFEQLSEQGAQVSATGWQGDVARGLVGVELQRFPAYLAELNVLIQLALQKARSQQRGESTAAIPPVSLICHDTLAARNSSGLFEDELPAAVTEFHDAARRGRYVALRDPAKHNAWFDVAVGNPPYVGEKLGATVISRTRQDPYWNALYAQHLDYLYWFLILGVSKLREGGRFGFITTEYWLRATGARPLRRFLAQHTQVDRLILFRDMRLFPDAPGQHSLIVCGRRVVPPGDLPADAPSAPNHLPRVSVLEPRAKQQPRELVLGAIAAANRSAYGARHHTAVVAPNALGAGSWAEVIMTRPQLERRRRIAALGPPALDAVEEGIITGANRVNNTTLRLLPQETAAEVRATARTGIFTLRADEVSALGNLNTAERELVRAVINTKEVFPYGCVLPAEQASLLYLPRPANAARQPPAVARELPFPDGLPALQTHLERFAPILRKKVADYKESRPWWSLHRGRPAIAAAEGQHSRWSSYAVTTRWGEGERLVVGLAPRHAVPADGLHALLPRDVEAAYLVALLMSTPVQELADALAPGQVRKDDLLALGLPRLTSDAVETITACGYQLADCVAEFVNTHGQRWPQLPDELRANPALTALALTAWQRRLRPPAQQGRLRDVQWTDELILPRRRGEPIREVRIDTTLFGSQVVAVSRANQAFVAPLREPHQDALAALAALFEGHAARGGTIGDLADLSVPLTQPELVAEHAADRAALDEAIKQYRAERDKVDAVVSAQLPA